MADTADTGLLEREANGIYWLTLNRPERANAISPAQRARMLEVLAYASTSPSVRVVVLGGTGRHFCTGADLSAAPAPLGEVRPPGFTADVVKAGVQRLVRAVLDCEVPVIASINGTAAGFGMHLALACDFVIAAESARFIEVFVRRGLAPDGAGAWLLPRLIGMQRAKELLMLGDDVPAPRAERIGLVNAVVPDAELESAVAALAARLAAAPTAMLAATKRLLQSSFNSDLGSALDAEAEVVEAVRTTADATEGISAFLERREPRFQGR